MISDKEFHELLISGKKIFFISDSHFNHNHILNFQPKRINEIKKMSDIINADSHNEMLIRKWNLMVNEDDIVIHLGDFAFKGISNIIPKLNGHKILILGNHDKKGINVYNGFEFIVRGLYVLENDYLFKSDVGDDLFSAIVIKDSNVLLSHYPATKKEFRERENEKGEMIESPINDRIRKLIKLSNFYNIKFNIHGHTHSNNIENENGLIFFNMSSDNINHAPRILKW